MDATGIGHGTVATTWANQAVDVCERLDQEALASWPWAQLAVEAYAVWVQAVSESSPIVATWLRDTTGAVVSEHPYDLGYWGRCAGLPAPMPPGTPPHGTRHPLTVAQRGWRDADLELGEGRV